MNSVWLVTSGSYGDYRVIIAFTTRELADAYVAAENVDIASTYRDECGVEEFPLFDRMPLPRTIIWAGQARMKAGAFDGDHFWSYEVPEWEHEDMAERTQTLAHGVIGFTVKHTDRAVVERRLHEWVVSQLGTDPDQ